MRPLHCEGCGLPAVVRTTSTRGPGGPNLYLCGVCADLGGAFVEAVKEGEPRMTALLLLKIHAKLSRLYDVRFGEDAP